MKGRKIKRRKYDEQYVDVRGHEEDELRWTNRIERGGSGRGAEASRYLDLLNLMIYWSRWSRCCFMTNVWTAVLHSSSDYLFFGGVGDFSHLTRAGGGAGPTFSQKYEMGGSPKLQSKLLWMLDIGVALKRKIFIVVLSIGVKRSIIGPAWMTQRHHMILLRLQCSWEDIKSEVGRSPKQIAWFSH